MSRESVCGDGIPWRRYDSDDPMTWPESGQRCLVTVVPGACGEPDTDMDTWFSTVLAGDHWMECIDEDVKWWAPKPAPCKEETEE